MKCRLFCKEERPPREIEIRAALVLLTAAFAAVCAPRASAGGDAPAWMHAVVNAPLPAHDEKTDAVLLYSEDILTVQPNGKMKSIGRRAYKILRPDGRRFARVHIFFDTETRVTNIHGWCIPAQGKDYEVKDKEAAEMGLDDIENGILMTDERVKVLQIPAAEIGNIVGYEYEREDRPYVMQDFWDFQDVVPVREARYTLQLPPNWEYKAMWINHSEIKSQASGSNTWQWSISDVPAIKHEDDMPPWTGVAGGMFVTLFPPPGSVPSRGFESWNDMGKWHALLYQGRRDASPEIKQKVAELTASSATTLAKMKVLASFLQKDIRYVGIELGIGGWQPHTATDIFAHRYGDCKDKATLLSGMLHEIGVDSYYIVINTVRGGASPDAPPALHWFNHAILAVKLPDKAKDPSLAAVVDHPKLGRLLIFDPTDELTPFGQLRGPLQANYGLLVTADGGELIELPKLSTAANSIERSAKLTLDAKGTLTGEVKEVRLGDRAASQRYALRTATKAADQIKPIETLLAHSLATYQITKATVTNLKQTDQPFGFNYSFVALDYAKSAGNLMLVRPRVLGSKSSGLLETKEPRKFPVEFEGPSRDVDTFEITLPPGYEVDDLPPPVNVDFGFANYQSKAEAAGNVLKYTRTVEFKELSVPLNRMDDLKKFYRIIASDERNNAVLKPVAH
jgi:Domain of Unknown Function with PDB structure (DUF3857)/Transglutaminase-like superfamily